MNIMEQFLNSKSEGTQISQAWRDLNEQMKRQEVADKDAAREEKFRELASRGFSPSAVDRPMLNSMGNMYVDQNSSNPQERYQNELKALQNPEFVAPGTGTGIPTPEASHLDRWKSQIDGLIQSGNPELQKTGLSLLGTYQSKVTAPPSKSPGAQYADELGLSGKARMKFIRDYATKSSGTVVNVGNGGLEGQMLTDQEKGDWGLDQSGTYAHTKTGPKPINPTTYTSAQLDSAGFASRMDQSEQTLLALHEAGFDPTSVRQKVGDIAGSASGLILSPSQQVHKQAADTWIRNKLRDESGATIGDLEMKREYETYFPQPGESDSVVYAKQLARRMAIRTMSEASGGKYKKEDFVEAEKLVEMAIKEDAKWQARQDKLTGAASNLTGPSYVPDIGNANFGD